MPGWSKEEAFPIIKYLIEQLCQKYGSADRDQIAKALLEDPKGRSLVEHSLQKSKRSLLTEAGNIIDWFSADLTQQTKKSTQFIHLYKRERVTRVHQETGTSRKVWLYRLSYQHRQTELLAEEVDAGEALVEGAVRFIKVNAYERSLKARHQCLEHYGTDCVVCNFNYGERYGSVGEGYIQVHHLKPLSQIKELYEVDPIEDLRPVCANCHAIIHRRTPPYTIEEVQQFIALH